MDPFTQKLLEKTRQRREELQAKLQKSTPQSLPRKRKPLQTDTTAENVPNVFQQNDFEEKRRKSSPKFESAKSADKPGTSQRDASGEVGADVENLKAASVAEDPTPKPATRKGRLQMLAAQINNWEDDLSHPQPPKNDSPEKAVKAAHTATPMDAKPSGPDTSRPPKPPRTFQEETKPTSRRSPRIQQQVNSAVSDAFTFGSASKQTPARPSKPPTPRANFTAPSSFASSRKHSDDEPTQKAVADRFSMWEKKAGDALTPMRQATPLRSARANTPAARSQSAVKPAFPAQAATSQSQTAQFKPEQENKGQTRRRSRSAAPTPERERTGASAPWQKPVNATGSLPKQPTQAGAAATPNSKQNKDNDNEWCRKQDDAFAKAPMSARKFAWEAKIAEQQTVATEHNRIMYRTRSATRLGDTPCQKQQAEDQLRQGQEKVYDPAERAKKERQAELDKLQNRFNNRGLLKSEQGASPVPAAKDTATSKPLASSVESLNDQYFTASDSEVPEASASNNGTAGSSADEKKVPNKRQVSFKSPTRAASRRKSDSPVESELEKKIRRRSSCKLPTLGYDSSSEEEMTPQRKFYPIGHNRASPGKIPRLGDESSADSLDDMRQISGSSIGSSVSSYSYHFVANGETPTGNSRDVVDFLDEAMNDDEASPEVVKPKEVVERRETRSARKNSPTSLYSIDQYRQKTKSVAVLPANTLGVRRPVSVYDTDDSTVSDAASSSQCSGVSDSDRNKRVKELKEFVKQEHNIIAQASNALNQCTKTGSTFAGSTEQVECNRLLLIACQRRQAYLCEIERINANPRNYQPKKGKGSLTISNIQLPLKREFVKKIGTPEDDTVHHFLLMVRAGAQVIVTQMVATHDALMRGTIQFPNLIKLNDIMNDFRYELEVYGMQITRDTTRDTTRQSAKKEKKFKSSSISRSRESASSSSVRSTSFTHITSLILSMDSVNQSSFKLSRVPYLSPLHGTIHMTLRCTMEANVCFRGFTNMFEDVGGFGAWHRRWCVLANNRVSYWKYPDDEKSKDPIGQLDVKDCVTTTVGLISRDKCARQNTIELVITRPATKADVANGRQISNRLVYDQYWFGMDTKADRLEWCDKLNEALANVRQWYSDAARPIASKRTNI